MSSDSYSGSFGVGIWRWISGAVAPRYRMGFGKWFGFTVALLYGITSLSITFFNKAVLSLYSFPYSNILTLGQILFSISFLMLMKRLGYIQYPDFNIKTAIQLIPLAAFFSLMAVSGLASLALVNVPMFSALRRISTLLVIAGERLLLGKITPLDEQLSVVVMVLGALIGAWGDLTFDLFGYSYTFFNCVVTAGYLIYIAKKSKETQLNTFGMMFYNNVLSLPFLLPYALFTEYSAASQYTQYNDTGFQVCFLMSSVQAFLLNYFIFLCSQVNSPLTTSITGQLKSILQTVLGFFVVDKVVATPILIAGLSFSTLASVWYSYIKYAQTAVKTQQHSRTSNV